jgi:hypothetical protein
MAAAAIAAAVFASGCGGSDRNAATLETRASSPPLASFPTGPCRQRPLFGVHDPDRLKLVNRCRAIVGIVEEPELNPQDGDLTFKVAPDPPYAPMLNAANRLKGGLHVEIVPADQPGCVKGSPVTRPGMTGLGRCTGAHVALPRSGEHVRAVGAYVLDVGNDWYEIHPAWLVRRARRGA